MQKSPCRGADCRCAAGVAYIATSQIFDDEMAARIQHHRDGRPPTGAPPSTLAAAMN
ncbi:bifunctional adenosylcobinamide kinase/adenosylcobinamide-phosphate guanylyltransferase [Klebsiella pneumoniae]|nr:bifunctional adenosylcobinamide kinase/adenosylcobinamide-phosphate guanylyltransferase [Klebsiella pneumoniae]